MKNKEINFKQVNNDAFGNPRFVVHFLNIPLTENENNNTIDNKYSIALKKAKKIGGKKFHNKQYGGGIVFSFYGSKEDFTKKINNL